MKKNNRRSSVGVARVAASIFVVGLVAIVIVNKIHNPANSTPKVDVANAATVPTLSVSPASGTFANGQTFNVNIVVDTASSSTEGIDVKTLNFNPNVLQVIDDDVNASGVQITPVLIFSPNPAITFNTVDNVLGTIRYSQVSAPFNSVPGNSFLGTATIATIHFRVIAGGTSNLTFDYTPGSTTDSNVAFQGNDLLGAVVNGSFTVDATAPTVSISAPAANATVSGSAVTVSATASDNVGVVGVQFKLDGANLGAEDTSSPFSVVWNTTTASNAVHTLTAVARDGVGNSTTSSSTSVTVNNVVPFDFSISNGGNKSVVAGSSTTNTVTTTLSAGSTAAVSFSASGLPTGATASFSPTSCSPTCTTTMTLNTTGSTPAAASTITVTATGGGATHATSFTLTVSAANQIPLGSLDEINTAGFIRGWSFDPDSNATSISVQIYINGPVGTGTLVTTASANLDRPDIRSVYGITGNHGFQVAVPATYQDGAYHSVYVYGIDTSSASITAILGNSGLSFTTRTIGVDVEALPTKVVSGTFQVLNTAKASLEDIPFTTNSLGQFFTTIDIASQTVYFKVTVPKYLTRLLSNINLGQTVSTVVAFPRLMAGDLNSDNIINSLDYSTLNSNWFGTSASADINADGIINSVDFSFMNQHWLITGEQ